MTNEEVAIVLDEIEIAWREGYEAAMKDYGITEEMAVKKL